MEKSLKEVADELMKKEGDVKGEVFRTHAAYIRYREGEEGVKKVEEKINELGYPIDFTEIKTEDWHKEALSVLVILTAKEIFDWTEEDIFDMGNFAPKHSFIIKMFIRHFLLIKDVFEKSGQYWDKHYNFGSLEKGEFSEKEKYITIILRDHDFHELVCGPYMKGYFLCIAGFSLKSEKITIEETKCVFRGDPYNEYVIKWV